MIIHIISAITIAMLFFSLASGIAWLSYLSAALLALCTALCIINKIFFRNKKKAEKQNPEKKNSSEDKKLQELVKSLKDEKAEISKKLESVIIQADSEKRDSQTLQDKYDKEINKNIFIHEIAGIISENQKINSLYDAITKKLAEEYSCECAFIMTIEKGVFKLKNTSGTIKEETLRALEISGLIDGLKEGSSVSIGSDHAERLSSVASSDAIKNILCVPLKTKKSSKPFGVAGLMNIKSGSFSKEDEESLSLAGLLIAISLQNYAYVSQLELSYEETMLCLAQALEGRDKYTQGHVDRVREFSEKLARAMNFSEEEIKMIKRAATLHDVGKIATPDGILHKESELTEEEWKIMKHHAEMSAKILEPISSLPREVIAMVRAHHERWDGKGYPHNLSKNAIPKGAQIIAVADAFDALTSDRPYRKGLGWDSALAKLKRESIGTQFDPEIITTFLLMMHDESIKRNKKKTKRESVEMLNIK